MHVVVTVEKVHYSSMKKESNLFRVHPLVSFVGYCYCWQEAADNNCVYRNEVHHSVSEQTQILSDVASDPTLPRTKAVRCAKCQHGEAVFFQATARGEEGMTLFFVCCNPNCGHRWRE
uniref:TFIIS-type domain-containing protein n=1 Tax=Brassica campestris TaxID=3711 RepID=A0A3P5ZGY6_BRACM|nr:unnamed protein product [Brassica rapa]